MRTKTERIHHTTRVKARVKRKLAQWQFPTDPASVGRAAAQHNTCACSTCTRSGDDPKLRTLFRDLMKLEELV
jgi:hypothetical protein